MPSWGHPVTQTEPSRPLPARAWAQTTLTCRALLTAPEMERIRGFGEPIAIAALVQQPDHDRALAIGAETDRGVRVPRVLAPALDGDQLAGVARDRDVEADRTAVDDGRPADGGDDDRAYDDSDLVAVGPGLSGRRGDVQPVVGAGHRAERGGQEARTAHGGRLDRLPGAPAVRRALQLDLGAVGAGVVQPQGGAGDEDRVSLRDRHAGRSAGQPGRTAATPGVRSAGQQGR